MENEVVGRRISPIHFMQTTEMFLLSFGDRYVLDWLWRGFWQLREPGSALCLSPVGLCACVCYLSVYILSEKIKRDSKSKRVVSRSCSA